MSASMIYIRHRSGRQRLISEAELADCVSAGWVEESRVAVEVAAAPAKKKKKKAE